MNGFKNLLRFYLCLALCSWQLHQHHGFVFAFIVIAPSLQLQSNDAATIVFRAVATTIILNTAPSSTKMMMTTTNHNTEHRRMGELIIPEQTVYQIMQDLNESGYTFRLVVIGTEGATILETTTPFGPILKLTQSPSTGA